MMPINDITLQAWTRSTSADEIKHFVRRNEYIIDMVENYALFWANLSRSRSKADATRATIILCKTITKKSMVSTIVESAFVKTCLGVFDMAIVELQSDWFIDGLDNFENIMTNYDKVKSCQIFKKFSKVCAYSAMFGLFTKLNIPIKNSLWNFSQNAATQKTIFDAPDFARAILDLVIYTLRQGRQSYIHGDLLCMFHSGETYEEWASKASELKLKSRYLSNPSALQKDYPDFSEFTFVAELKAAIEKGRSMIRVLPQGPERRYVQKLLADIMDIDASLLTKQAAQEFRKAPLGVFVYGFPGVGKSTVLDIMFSYFGKVRGLDTDSKYMYTKNSAAKYFDGFQSYMWCIVLDDVACFKKSKVMGIDESVQEIIKIFNNIPYTPDQAALEDKGRTPMKAELGLVTSNVEDLSLCTYFEKSGAAFRRLKYRVQPTVKPQFATECGRLDSTKTIGVTQPGMYDDFWNYEVHEAQVYADMGGDYNDQKPMIFEGLKPFLVWYHSIIVKHFAEQDMMVNASKKTRDVDICHKCMMPLGICTCEIVDITSIQLQNACLSCQDKPRCVRCEFCDCICKCAPALRGSYNPLGAQRAQEAITTAQLNKARKLERDYLNHLEDLRRDDRYFYDDENEYDAMSACLDHNIDTEDVGFLAFIIRNCVRVTLYAVYEFESIRGVGLWCYSFPMARTFIHRHIMPKFVTPSTQKLIMRKMGDWVDRRLGATRMTDLLLGVLTSIMASITFIWVLRSIFSSNKEVEIIPDTEQQVKVVQPVTAQRIISAGRAPVYVPEERENVWINNDFVLTKMDVSPICSFASKDITEFTRVIGNNFARVTMLFLQDGLEYELCQNVICIGGQSYVINAHALKIAGETFNIRLMFQQSAQGVVSDVCARVSIKDFIIDTERDLAFFQLPAAAPRKDIRFWFAPKSFDGKFDGYLILRRDDGTLEHRKVTRIRKEFVTQHSGGIDFKCYTFMYNLTIPTSQGDCGSPLIVMSGYGPQLVGFHYALAPGCVGYATQICPDDFEKFAMQCDFPIISPRAPSLSAPGKHFEIEQLHKKSAFRFIQQGTATVYGTIERYPVKSKSRVSQTPICDVITTFDTKFIPKFSVKEGAPSMGSWEPWRLALLEMTQPITDMDTSILRDCAKNFASEIINGLTPEDFAGLHVYDIGTAINGAPGLKFVDKMNRNTSMGFPFNTTKKAYLHPIVSERWADGVEFSDVVLERVHDCLEGYKRGELYSPVFSGCLKDEPKSFKKIAMHKTRIFTGAPADWSVVVRMYYLAFIRCVQKNTFLFESGPGTNAHSLEWEKIREHLVQHGEDQLVAGDYASFDKKMATNATMYAYWVMIEVCRASGNYSEEDLQVLWCVANDTCYPIVNMKGDLVRFHCGNPSGQPLTVILNGIVNALYLRYTYAKMGYNLKTFKSNVALFTYGDDNAFGVSKRCPDFNHTNIQRILGEVGIGYTMADKEAVSRPYIHINEVSFLKRMWRYEPAVDAYVAPLEWDSINKMLTVHVTSKSVSANEQIVSACESAVNESFFHGREKFEELSLLLRKALKMKNLENYITETTFMSWDALVERFNRCSKHVIIQRPRNAVTAQSSVSESTKVSASMGVTLY
jgi:hypothetical protein